MKCAIMQPYLFPYIGYYQLISAVDTFVLYDDVNYIKGGWINRNFILANNAPQRITLQLSGASPNKLINEVGIGNNKRKLLTSVELNYRKAPYFESAFPVIESCINNPDNNLSSYLHQSITMICDYLEIQTKIILSSNLNKDSALKGSSKVIDICKSLHAETYINAIGGSELYDSDDFSDHDLALQFIKTGDISYHQQQDIFVPNLSILDVMMFNPKENIHKLLNTYELI